MVIENCVVLCCVIAADSEDQRNPPLTQALFMLFQLREARLYVMATTFPSARYSYVFDPCTWLTLRNRYNCPPRLVPQIPIFVCIGGYAPHRGLDYSEVLRVTTSHEIIQK